MKSETGQQFIKKDRYTYISYIKQAEGQASQLSTLYNYYLTIDLNTSDTHNFLSRKQPLFILSRSKYKTWFNLKKLDFESKAIDFVFDTIFEEYSLII